LDTGRKLVKLLGEYPCNELLIQFMKHYLTNNSISLDQQLSQQQVKELFAFSAKHDVAHLVGVVAEKLPTEEQAALQIFSREQMKAMFRYEKMQREMEKICSLFEDCAIPYIPLKGAVIRLLYHEPWHRTSCDIDILVPADRLDEAISALQEKLQYERRGGFRHDISMWSPKGIHLELHFDIDETHVTREQFWENATAEPGCCCHRLSNEMLITAHIAHMAKHFLIGGCGLRPFLDLWFMRKKLTYDETCMEQLLNDAGLQAFYEKVNSLLEAWFCDGEMDAFLKKMEEYILTGGVYGNRENGIAVKRTQGWGTGKYLTKRLFPPLNLMKFQYPVLNKHPWILPWCWLCRGFRHLRNGKAWGIAAEYRINRDFSKNQLNETDHLLRGLGLKG